MKGCIKWPRSQRSLLGLDIPFSCGCLARRRLWMNIIQETDVLATEKLSSVYEDLKGAVLRAVRENRPIHEVEKAIWEQLLRLGREALAQIFSLLGDGDMGETVALPDGR